MLRIAAAALVMSLVGGACGCAQPRHAQVAAPAGSASAVPAAPAESVAPRADAAATRGDADLISIDRALTRMRELDLALYELLEMIAFAGLTIAEVAELRGVASRTVNRDLVKARGLMAMLMGD